MKTVEIKKKLINEINLSNNKNLLEEFYYYLNQDNKSQIPYKLNNEQITAVEEARTQIKNGEFLTGEEADQDIEKWLNR
ncbi:hypothetical protein [Flavobacteriaceae bacterium 14752]|uniref:hypothetical protein n=1 Tax=Mesohalobacter salilacus TaxID=2491711 RepID=UPI000F63BBCA|nr:hypothetical protein EIG84_11265 [Flavobacteriaceae bacterium 14752]